MAVVGQREADIEHAVRPRGGMEVREVLQVAADDEQMKQFSGQHLMVVTNGPSGGFRYACGALGRRSMTIDRIGGLIW